MKLKIAALAFVVMLLVAGLACKTQSQPNGADVLVMLEAEFQKTTAEKGWDGFVTYFAEDGVELSDGGPAAKGKQAIRESLGQWTPDMSLTWTPTKAEMAVSGDLGYTYGTYVFKAKDKEGNLVAHYGKYTTVWKKQKDEAWKVVVDIGNSSPAPSTP